VSAKAESRTAAGASAWPWATTTTTDGKTFTSPISTAPCSTQQRRWIVHDVTSKAGVGNAERWGTSAAFGDYDNDGNLDLYVANYVDLDLNNLPKFGQGPFCTYRGMRFPAGRAD